MASITVSPSGHGFLDQSGAPFFWLGDTLWELFRAFTPADACRILERRKEQGFTVIQAMLTGFNDGRIANTDGVTPWEGTDPGRPNEAYYRSADQVLECARQLGLIVVLGVYHQQHRESITVERARAHARRIAERWAALPHVVWTMYPEATQEFVPVIRELAAGLREGDRGAHLVTLHPDPSPTSSSFIHDEPWLAFNQMQPWKSYELQHPMVIADWARTPPKPVIMAEGGYEGVHLGTVHTPHHVRKQAWWSCLAGGFHTYGHADSHHKPPALWPRWIEAPGARHVCMSRTILTSLPRWWELAPDQELFLEGRGEGLSLNAAATCASAGWSLVYLGGQASVTLDRRRACGGSVARASWIDPVTGLRDDTVLPRGDRLAFETPPGREDALLFLSR